MDLSQRQSAEIGELTKAMIAAKKQYKKITETDSGQYGTFINLDQVEEATGQALADSGLLFDQGPVFIEGRVMLQTQLTHAASGQWRAWHMPLDIPEDLKGKSIDQAKGGAITYQRRYSAYGILGLGKGDGSEEPDRVQSAESVKYAPKTNQSAFISDAQVGFIKKLLREHADPDKENKLCNYFGISSIELLHKEKMNEALKGLGFKPKE